MSDRRNISLAWHDVVCPEGSDCRDRYIHAWSQPLSTSGVLDRFLDRLKILESKETL